MSRPLRIEYEHAFYHVTVRGNAKCNIFLDDFDRDLFLDVVRSSYDRFGFLIHAFVLMDNHYHFLIETPHANLSASMRHINGVYTQSFNRRHRAVGHLFQGRFKAIVVDRDDYYLELIRYIHLNPWRAKMVKRSADFKYSGHRAIVDTKWAARWGDWYDRNLVLKEFGRREGEAIERYREFVNAGKGKPSPLDNVIGGYALGKRDFADWLWKNFLEGKEHQGIVGAAKLRPLIDVQKVIEVVSKEFNVLPEDLFKSRQGRMGHNVGRGMSLYIICRFSGKTQREIGESAGGMTASAVAEAVRRFSLLMESERHIRKQCDRLVNKIR